jgi:Flp pilus assembly pilin Flp
MRGLSPATITRRRVPALYPSGSVARWPRGVTSALYREGARMNELIQLAAARLAPKTRGQTVVEYGLLLTFIALVVVLVLGQLGAAIYPVFQSAAAGF